LSFKDLKTWNNLRKGFKTPAAGGDGNPELERHRLTITFSDKETDTQKSASTNKL